jgi:hypothetical protein
MIVHPAARLPALPHADHYNCNRTLFYNYKKGQSTENPKQDFSLEIDLFMITHLEDNERQTFAACY